MEITLNCTRGNAKIRLDRVLPKRKGAQVLTGKRRKWDTLHWSLITVDELAIQGLWRGRYADAKVKADELLAALDQVGATDTAESIRRAINANLELTANGR